MNYFTGYLYGRIGQSRITNGNSGLIIKNITIGVNGQQNKLQCEEITTEEDEKMELRALEEWRERGCNACNSNNEVKELVVGGMVTALCKECRKKLYDILFEDVWN